MVLELIGIDVLGPPKPPGQGAEGIFQDTGAPKRVKEREIRMFDGYQTQRGESTKKRECSFVAIPIVSLLWDVGSL